LDKLSKDRPTHFFDWLITDFETVLRVLSAPKLEFKLDISPSPQVKGMAHVLNKHFSQCISIHDVKLPATPQRIERDYKQKYLRRHRRLLDLIRKGKTTIHFVRLQPEQLTVIEYQRFADVVTALNPALDFRLVSLHEGDESMTVDRFQVLGLAPFDRKIAKRGGWKGEHYNWKDVWKAIGV
jgi:hypothetical protein